MGLLSLSTCENPVTMLNMKEIDSLNYVKLDVLGLDNIQLINETCKLANIERLTPQNIDDNDEKVWMSIREDTTGIFQWEGTGEHYIKDLFSDDTIDKIKKQNPDFKFIDLMSVGNGAIRLAGASYRDELSHGIFRDNGNNELNKLLSSTLGYLVYQELILSFLHEFCGYTMGEADIVRRGFAKKLGTEQYIPRIKEGFIKTMKEKYNTNEKESEKIVESFIQVIQDASSYLFSLNHSLPYSYIGYICGYLRYYYPLEFFTVFLNINKDNAEKSSKALEYTGVSNYRNDELEEGTLIVVGVDTKYSPKLKFLNPLTGNTENVKISKKVFKNQTLEIGDMIIVYGIDEKPKKTKMDGKWIPTGEYEFWLSDYKIISQD